jgi:hypothetical protein
VKLLGDRRVVVFDKTLFLDDVAAVEWSGVQGKIVFFFE